MMTLVQRLRRYWLGFIIGFFVAAALWATIGPVQEFWHRIDLRQLKLQSPIKVIEVSSDGEVQSPVLIAEHFVPSGWMGDAIAGKAVRLEEALELTKKFKSAIRFTVTPDQVGWAGVYWQHPANNWGELPGLKILGANRLTFWAAGLKGGELVSFKIGGGTPANAKYQDTLNVSFGPVALTKDWRQFAVDLSGQNLSNVAEAFAWFVSRSENPQGAAFSIADPKFESGPTGTSVR